MIKRKFASGGSLDLCGSHRSELKTIGQRVAVGKLRTQFGGHKDHCRLRFRENLGRAHVIRIADHNSADCSEGFEFLSGFFGQGNWVEDCEIVFQYERGGKKVGFGCFVVAMPDGKGS